MKNSVEQCNVVYPKFMNGEAVVRKVPMKQNFGKVIGLVIYNYMQCGKDSLNPSPT
jgi:hypothetical protein